MTRPTAAPKLTGRGFDRWVEAASHDVEDPLLWPPGERRVVVPAGRGQRRRALRALLVDESLAFAQVVSRRGQLVSVVPSPHWLRRTWEAVSTPE